MGAVRCNGIEIYGLTKSPSLNVIEETKSFRELTNIQNDLYIISSLDINYIRIMQNEKGEVFIGNSNKVKKIADSIFDYFLLDVRENINVENVMSFLELLNVPRWEYGVGYIEEGLCIEKEEDNWIVYIGERGSKNDIKKFEKESEACEYFLMDEIDYALRD